MSDSLTPSPRDRDSAARSHLAVQVADGLDFRKIGGLVKRLIHPKTVGSRLLGLSVLFLAPGEEVVQHRHDFEEAYFVVSGTGEMMLGNEKYQLRPMLAVYIPGGENHWQRNTGNEAMVVVCATAPPPEVW